MRVIPSYPPLAFSAGGNLWGNPRAQFLDARLLSYQSRDTSVHYGLVGLRKLTAMYVTILAGKKKRKVHSKFLHDCLQNKRLKYNLLMSCGPPVFNTLLAEQNTSEFSCFLWKRTFWRLLKIGPSLDSFSSLYFIYSLAAHLTHS